MLMSESNPDLEPWRTFFKTFKVDTRFGASVQPASAESLDRFESETGVRLPAGYRGYLQVFGPGCLLVGSGSKIGEMFIRAPYCADPSYELMKSIERNRQFREDPPRHLSEQTRRIVEFAWNGLGDTFGWDPEEATDAAGPEFAVYAWYRLEGVVKVADTFRGFMKFVLDLDLRREHSTNQVYNPDAEEADLNSPRLNKKRVFQP
jgi:hypothetical protein